MNSQIASYNIRTEFSHKNGVIGTIDEVKRAQKNCGFSYIGVADFNSMFSHSYLDPRDACGITVSMSTDDEISGKNKSRKHRFISLYPYSYNGITYIRKFFLERVCEYKYYTYRISNDVIRDFLFHHRSSVFAITLKSLADLFLLSGLDNVFFEHSQLDMRVFNKSVFCQSNTTAVPENFFSSQMINYNKFNRDSNTIPYILSLRELNMIAQRQGHTQFLHGNPKELSQTTKFFNPAGLPTPQYIPDIKALKKSVTNPKYRARLVREIKILKEKNFLHYIYLVADIVREAKKHGIIVGTGRGSSCGSLLCYYLGITAIDPIKYGLLFERFISIDRDDMPDIDIDFSDRNQVYDIIKQRYTFVYKVSTELRIQKKSALDTVSRAMGFTPPSIELAKSILDNSLDTFHNTLQQTELLKNNPIYETSLDLENRLFSTGVHAGGVIIADKDITYYAGAIKEDNDIIAHIDKYKCDTLNLLKIDILGVETLNVINNTLKRIGKKYDTFIKKIMKQIDTNNKPFTVLHENKFQGIFQCEGESIRNIILGLTTNNVEITFKLLSVITAIGRPAGLLSGMAYDFVNTVKVRSSVQCHNILKESYGYVVYQEQIMELCRVLGDFNIEEVTNIRKAISKKTGSLTDYEKKFKENAKKKNRKNVDVDKLWREIQYAGEYAFNKSHSVAYSTISYITAYLKYYYPKDFYISLLTSEKDKKKRTMILHEANAFSSIGSVSLSDEWDYKDDLFIPPVTAVKGIGDKKYATIKNRGTYTKNETELVKSGIELHKLPDDKHPKYKIVQNAYPIYYKDLSTFVLYGEVVYKKKYFINDITKVDKRGTTVNVDGYEGDGYYIGFKIYTEYAEMTIRSSYMNTTKTMLSLYNIIQKNTLCLFLLQNNYDYGFEIVNLKII